MTYTAAQQELIQLAACFHHPNITYAQLQQVAAFAGRIAIARAGGPGPSPMPATYTAVRYPAGYLGAPGASSTFTSGAAIVESFATAQPPYYAPPPPATSMGAVEWEVGPSKSSTQLVTMIAPVPFPGTPTSEETIQYSFAMSVFLEVQEATLTAADQTTLANLIATSAAYRRTLP
jgi:hypothetical protein